MSLGTPLEITLPKTLSPSQIVVVKISYTTNPDSGAAQWLTKDMTLGKTYPFMFTQCEAILARNLLPCQDSPSVKVRVTSALTVENPLVALFAGILQGSKQNGDNTTTYYYEVSQIIPTYLIAVAVGDLQSRKISPRSTVWAEKELVDAAAAEFEDTEKFIQTVIYIYL